MTKFIGLLFLFSILAASSGDGLCGLTHTLPPVEHPVLTRTVLDCPNGTIFNVRSNVESGSASFDEVCFILVDDTGTSRIYVEDVQWENNKVSNGVLNQLSDTFNSSTPNAAIPELTGGIKTGAEWLFGPPPNRDGSGITNILLMDVRDNFNGGNYVAGYFDPHDQSSSAGSNMKDIVYLDCEQVNMSTALSNEATYTLAHEYEHLLHYAADPYEGLEYPDYNPWLDEGLADLSPSLLGIGHRKYGPYLNDTSIGLDRWENGGLEYYAKSALFMQYFFEIYGYDGVSAVFTDTDRRIESLKNYIGESQFDSFFDEWVQATISGDYEILNCLYGIHPQYNLESQINSGYGEPGIQVTNDIRQYSVHHVYIPGLVEKNEVIDLNSQGSSFLFDVLTEDFIPTNDPGVWLLDSLSHPLVYTKAFHSDSRRDIDFITTIASATNFDEIEYDNNEVLYPISGVDVAVNQFNITGQAVLTRASIQTGGEEEIIVRLKKGSQNGAVLFEQMICQPLGLGWTDIDLTAANIVVEDEAIYLEVLLGDNSMSYSSYYPDHHSGLSNGLSFYATGSSSYQPLSQVSVGSSNLMGNWMIRLTTADTNLITVLPEITNIISAYPNPFYTAEINRLSIEILPVPGYPTTVRIFNLLGQHIRTIYQDIPDGVEPFLVYWNGTDEHEHAVPSGIYFIHETASGRIRENKIILIK